MRIGSIVLRVDDLPAQLAFWSAALDYVPRYPPDDDWASLRPRSGGGPNLSLSRRPSEIQNGPRIHLDLYSEHQTEDIERLIGLGASHPEEIDRPANADYVILADPEGNRFCVVDTADHHHAPAPPPPDAGAQEWDARYSQADRVWSGEPNGALVAEIAEVTPGSVLDVGCGEGADAIWLAQRGWQVTALDVSGVAIERGRANATRQQLSIEWIQAGLIEAQLEDRRFDLVSAQYPALAHTSNQAAEHALIDAVAPGGHLLVVHHVLDAAGIERARSHGFDPTAFVSPADVAALLDDTWDVSFDEHRPRTISGGAGAHHADDVVLHARRLTA